MLINIGLGTRAAIHEYVSLSRMTMEVTVEEDRLIVILSTLLGQQLSIVYFTVEKFGGICPSSIEVYTQNVATIVTVNYSVWVKHGDNLENKEFSQSLSFFRIKLEQEVYRTLDHK